MPSPLRCVSACSWVICRFHSANSFMPLETVLMAPPTARKPAAMPGNLRTHAEEHRCHAEFRADKREAKGRSVESSSSARQHGPLAQRRGLEQRGLRRSLGGIVRGDGSGIGVGLGRQQGQALSFELAGRGQRARAVRSSIKRS